MFSFCMFTLSDVTCLSEQAPQNNVITKIMINRLHTDVITHTPNPSVIFLSSLLYLLHPLSHPPLMSALSVPLHPEWYLRTE